MTAQVFNQHSHIAMTATMFKEHTPKETVLAQTGGNDHDFQNFFAQTQPETSEMSTQTEPSVESLGINVQNMRARVGFEEGQEHIGVQCEMGQTEQNDVKSSEIESYANNMWQDLQQATDQDCFMKRQEPTNISEAKTNNGLDSEDQMHHFIGSVETDVNDVLQAQHKQQYSEMDVHTAETIIKYAVVAYGQRSRNANKERRYEHEGGLQERDLGNSITEQELESLSDQMTIYLDTVLPRYVSTQATESESRSATHQSLLTLYFDAARDCEVSNEMLDEQGVAIGNSGGKLR
uniref:Uncharacterized protein n=1 Tax=Cryptomonas curvata TaxID=233186 RepID=A0A7S0QTI9_9CRYP|mmetsp:Transcript_51988/g.108597  ORF Transcript_51988/g.108597 Transcript_51988/m.108597 type:complete len:292 (+) Transcript_51988:196-1071(+)